MTEQMSFSMLQASGNTFDSELFCNFNMIRPFSTFLQSTVYNDHSLWSEDLNNELVHYSNVWMDDVWLLSRTKYSVGELNEWAANPLAQNKQVHY